MNAEVTVGFDMTAEFDEDGILVTLFLGPDSDGDVYTFPFLSMEDDLIELCTVTEDGVAEADKAFAHRVAAELEAMANRIRNRVA